MRPAVLTIDATVVSPTLPSALPATLQGDLFNRVAEIKNDNHLQGCNERERGFLPIVFNVHGGVGPEIARQWLHSIFAVSFVHERMMGKSGADTARRREIFMQSLHAVSTLATDMMLSYCLKTDTAPRTRSSSIPASSATHAAAPCRCARR